MVHLPKILATSALALGALASAVLAPVAPAQANDFWGPALALGVVGLAAGAMIAGQPGYYGPAGYYEEPGCVVVRPVRNYRGHIVGYRRFYAC